MNEWLKKYNEVRPHSGKYCYGKTPLQTFLDAKHLAKEKQLDILHEQQPNESADCVHGTLDHLEVKYFEVEQSKSLSDRQVSER